VASTCGLPVASRLVLRTLLLKEGPATLLKHRAEESLKRSSMPRTPVSTSTREAVPPQDDEKLAGAWQEWREPEVNEFAYMPFEMRRESAEAAAPATPAGRAAADEAHGSQGVADGGLTHPPKHPIQIVVDFSLPKSGAKQLEAHNEGKKGNRAAKEPVQMTLAEWRAAQRSHDSQDETKVVKPSASLARAGSEVGIAALAKAAAAKGAGKVERAKQAAAEAQAKEVALEVAEKESEWERCDGPEGGWVRRVPLPLQASRERRQSAET